MLPLLALSLSDKGAHILSKIEIPKVWTDEAMKTWELPNPKPEYSPQPVSEEYYYAMAERTISDLTRFIILIMNQRVTGSGFNRWNQK